MLISSDL
jgi:hypothetical protein